MKHQQTPLISPAPGTQRVVDSFHFGDPSLGRKAYLQSSLHADELPGMYVLYKLKQSLKLLEQQHRLRGEIVLVPVANPIGQNQHLMDVHLGRYELENGTNFNRGYLDTYCQVKKRIAPKLSLDAEENKHSVRSAIKAELEAWPVKNEFESLQQALQLLSHDADIMLDLHCDFEAALHLYSTEYSWPKIEPLARLMGSEINMLADETGGNPFDSSIDMVWKRLKDDFGESIPDGCCAATVELRGQLDVSDDYADQDVQAILGYLQLNGFISGKAPTLPVIEAPSCELTCVETLSTKQGGLLVLKVEPGQWIQAGQVFAEVIDPISDKVEQVIATQAGRVYSRSNRRMATAGMLVGNVAGSTPIRSGYLLAP